MIRRLISFVASTGVVVAVLGSRLTLAQQPASPEGPADPALVAAKTDFEEAQVLYIREAYNDAAAKFLAAYDKKPFAAFLFNAAVSFEKTKKYEQAMQFFEKYLEKDPEAKDASLVRERVDGLKALLAPPAAPPAADPAGTPEAQPPAAAPETRLPRIETKGLVIIDSKPPGALIYLDDKKSGVFARTPWQGSLPPKAVKLIVEARGWKSEERSISPRTDKVHEVYVALSEEHFLGWIEVASNVAGADVFLDRKDIGALGRTPYTGHVKPGKHTVWLERDGYVAARQEIEVAPGTATTHMIKLEKVANGWITVAGKQSRGARLLVDGAPACEAPCRHQVAPGKHAVEVEKRGFEEYEGEIEVGRSAEAELQVSFSPKPPRTSAWSATAVSALLFVGGVYAGQRGKTLKDDLARDIAAGMGDSGDPRGSRGKYWYIGADALFTLSAATAIVAAINFLRSGPDSTAEIETKMVGFVPSGQGPGGAAVLQGRF